MSEKEQVERRQRRVSATFFAHFVRALVHERATRDDNTRFNSQSEVSRGTGREGEKVQLRGIKCTSGLL